MTHKLILMRGISGSGKSHRARELANGNNDIICSADKFFGEAKEEYLKNWDPSKLHIAHQTCQKMAMELMKQREPLVIVDNTNTTRKEMMPYFKMAVENEYQVQIEESTSPWWKENIVPYLHDKKQYQKELEDGVRICFEKTLHGVPFEVIQRQLQRFDPNTTVEMLTDISKG